jgi:hypothetical protein
LGDPMAEVGEPLSMLLRLNRPMIEPSSATST